MASSSLGQKINLLGNAQKSGVNLSRVINQAASVRSQQQQNSLLRLNGSTKSVLNNQALSGLRQNYSAIHDFAQDQLTHISRKELLQENRRKDFANTLNAGKSHHRRQEFDENHHDRGSIISYVSAKESTMRSNAQHQKYHSQVRSRGGRQAGGAMRGGSDTQSHKAISVTIKQRSRLQHGRSSTPINQQCCEVDCHRPSLKDRLCKHHMAVKIKKAFRFNFKNMYRGPDQAFNNLDFAGKGYIIDQDIFTSPIMQRIKFGRSEIAMAFESLNLFNNVSMVSALKDGVPPNGMSFDKFREIFFPQLHILDEEAQSDEDRDVREMERKQNGSKKDQANVLSDRVRLLDMKIQSKIAEQCLKVRKAFLAFDKDFDGYVTIEDFMQHFGTDPTIEYADLVKLLKIKDRNGEGKIDFQDFSRWFGNAIHKLDGFYFRHDSKTVNPPFNLNEQRFKQKFPEKDLDQCKQAYNVNLIDKIVAKIYYQWKTMRKSFMSMDVSKNGYISLKDLNYYLTHWGVVADEKQAQHLFDYFDADGDGQISYKDFQLTVGKEMQPDQGAYWRQDMPRQTRIKSCKTDHCWLVAQDFSVFCKIHLKMVQSKAFILMQDIKTRMKSNWREFISMLQSKADPEDPDQLYVDDFKATLLFFKIKLSSSQLSTLTDSFPGRKEGQRQRIRVGRFYDINVAIEHSKTYKNMPNRTVVDQVQDASGYTGQMYRKKVKRDLVAMTDAELVAVFLKENKMMELNRLCREINPDKNGVVTIVELDDILRILYLDELDGKDLSSIYEPFCSVQNKILINYKEFREMIASKMKQIDVNFSLPTSALTSNKQTPAAAAQFFKTMNSDYDGREQTVQEPQTEKKHHHRRSSNNRSSINFKPKGEQPVSGQGVVAIKDFIDFRGQKESDRLSQTELNAYFKKRANSNLNNVTLNRKQLDFEDSPYNDFPIEQANLRSLSPMLNMNMKNRPGSSANIQNKTCLLKNKLAIQELENREEQVRCSSSMPRRGKSQATLRPDTSPSKARAALSELKQYQQNKRAVTGRNGPQMTRTIDPTGRNNSEGRLTPLSQIDEATPMKQSRVGTAVGHKNARIQSIIDGKSSRRSQMRRTLTATAAPSQISSTGLQNSARPEDHSQLRKENIKAKVAYEWKQIYKNLIKDDSNETGTVHRVQFQKACQNAGVNLSNEEVRKIGLLFPYQGDTATVDFQRMSKELNLHYSSLNFVAARQSKLENLKDVLSKSGKSDCQYSAMEMRKIIQDYQNKELYNSSTAKNAVVATRLDKSPSDHSRAMQTTAFNSLTKSKSINKRKSLMPSRADTMHTTLEDKKVSIQSNVQVIKQQEEIERRYRIAQILQTRRTEFVDLVESYMLTKGAGQDSKLLATADFKQILQAFGIKLTPQELKRLVVQAQLGEPLSSVAQKSSLKVTQTPNRAASLSFLQNRLPEDRRLRSKDETYSAIVKMHGGRPMMTPGPVSQVGSQLGRISEAPAASENLNQRVKQNYGYQSRGGGVAAAIHPSNRRLSEMPGTAFTTLSHHEDVRMPGNSHLVQNKKVPGINVNEFLKIYA